MDAAKQFDKALRSYKAAERRIHNAHAQGKDSLASVLTQADAKSDMEMWIRSGSVDAGRVEKYRQATGS